ncbi:MAG: SANT/Myb-like DNA-binding domain-containing protein [Planctomycetota bacterium]|jgi:hypothetical protein
MPTTTARNTTAASKSLFKNIPDAFLAETTRIARFTRYILGARNEHSRGRVFDGMTCAVFWPQLSGHRYLEHVADLIYPSRDRREADDRQVARSYSPEDQLKARVANLKTETEHLLGPLVLPSDCSAASKIISDYAALHEVTTLADPLGDWFLDPANYTVFRRVQLDKGALVRTRIAPPELPPVTAIMQDVPDALVLLWKAWCLATDTNNQLDPQDTGVDYVRTGHIFVNWDRFYASGHCPPTVKLRADEVNGAIMKLPSFCAVKKGIIERDLTSKRVPPPSTPRLDVEVRSLSLYLELCIRTDAFAYNVDTADPATLFDPLVLCKKPHIFDGRWHWRRRARARECAAASSQAKKDGILIASKVKVYAVPFRPFDYLEDLPPGFPLWFDKDHEEIVYAVRRHKALCFTNPPALGKATPAEHEVWKRVMDSVKLLETIYETDKGTVVDIRKQCRSKFFSQARDEHLQRFLQVAAEEALSFNTAARGRVKAARLKDARNRAGQEFSVRTGMSAGLWYHHGVLPDAVKQLINEDTYRRIANVVVPGQEDQGVQTRHFFTPELVVLMNKFAQATVTGVTSYNPDLEVVMTNAVGAAPYVLAWTRFCEATRKTDLRYLGKEQKHTRTRWTPPEDLVLLEHYRRYPRMSASEWRALLTKLPTRTEAMCRARIPKIKHMVSKGVRASTAERLRIGFSACDAETARRIVYLFGYIKEQCNYPHFRKGNGSVSSLISMDHSLLRQKLLPSSYSREAFTRIVDC